MAMSRYPFRTDPAAGLPGVRQFFPEIGDVVFVQLDLFLVRFKPVEHALIVALAAKTDSFLFGEVFLGLLQELLLAGEFLFQNAAAVGIALLLRLRIDAGKVGGAALLAAVWTA